MDKPVKTQELLVKVSQGNRLAFAAFFDIYSHNVYRFAGYFIRNDEVCEEIVSDVFINIWNSRHKLPEIENLENYLFIITRNISFNYLDKESRQPVTAGEPFPESRIENTNPERELLYKETEQLIYEAISKLPERCRTVFLLSREEKMKYHQIAQALSISEKTVHAQMVTALKKLNESLRRYLYFFVW